MNDNLPNGLDVVVQADQCFNYTWALSDPAPPSARIQVDAWLQDPWKDARFVVHAYDSSGNGREWRYDYDAPSVELPAKVEITDSRSANPCVRVPIVNNDSTPVSINAVHIIGDNRITMNPATVTDVDISPGDTLWVTLCYSARGQKDVARGELVVRFVCNLRKTIPLSAVAPADFVTTDLDFGDVRIGDTACRKVPVVNTGSTEVTLNGMTFTQPDKPFTVDTVGVFPITLQPGDTLWINVCYNPDQQERSLRTDSVHSMLLGSKPTTYIGRGVRPKIQDIVVNWGKRRVGSRNDSSFVIQNSGNAACIVQAQPLPDGQALWYDGSRWPIQLAQAEQHVLPCTFSPSERGVQQVSIPLQIDWLRHEPVQITLIGEGTMPELITWDVDMGKVLVGTQKDSVAVIMEAGGNEDLYVYEVAKGGSDLAAIRTALLMNQSVMEVGDVVNLPITFIPTRSGYHEILLDVEHNGAPLGERGRSRIRIFGEGIPIPRREIDVQLSVNATAPTCVDQQATMSVVNSGNTVVTISRIVADLDGTPIPVDVPLPVVLDTSESVILYLPFVLTRRSAGIITATLTFSDDEEITKTVHVGAVQTRPTLTIAPIQTSQPGNVVTITAKARSEQFRTVPENLVVRLFSDRTKWSPSLEPVTVVIVDQVGTRTEYILPKNNGSELSLELQKGVLSPYELRFEFPGITLWNNPTPNIVELTLEPSECSEGEQVNGIMYTDVCAGALRMVRIGALGQATVQVRQHPVRGELNLTMGANIPTSVDLYLVDSRGIRHLLGKQFPLEKGEQHCIFSVAGYASGLYGLVIAHESGEEVVPILIVN